MLANFRKNLTYVPVPSTMILQNAVVLCSAMISEYVYSHAVQCDDTCGMRRFCAVPWFLSMRGWNKDEIRGYVLQGHHQEFQSRSQPNTSVLLFSVFTPRNISHRWATMLKTQWCTAWQFSSAVAADVAMACVHKTCQGRNSSWKQANWLASQLWSASFPVSLPFLLLISKELHMLLLQWLALPFANKS